MDVRQVIRPRKFALMVLLMAFLVGVLGPVSGYADWEPLQDKDGIRIYSKGVEGSNYKAFRAVTRIDTSVDSLLAVMDDTDSCPEWVHQCKDPKLINYIDFKERYTYQVSDLPFPVGDRDIVLHAVVSKLPGERNYMLEMKGVPDHIPPEKKHVRIPQITSVYTFITLPEGGVEVTWEQHAEPGGSIPAWLANRLLVDLPHNTLDNLRQIVQKEVYRAAEIKYENGDPVGFVAKPWE